MTKKQTLTGLLVGALTIALIGGLAISQTPGTPETKSVGTASPRPTPEAESTPTPEAEPVAVDYFVVPHPDDEFEVWSQVENSDAYKVFILMTRGEGTGLCAQRSDPSVTCAQARTDSWVNFFVQMSQTDETIPGDFEYTYREKEDVRLWQDKQGRGVLVAFDYGDGNLTPEEVEIAVRQTMGNAEYGIPAADTTRIFGAYANATNYDCYVYPHPDHIAIHTALTTEHFSADTQGYAACASSPGVSFTAQVSDESLEAAWGSGGAFHTHYGWLGGYQVDPHGQSQIFHGYQAFYTRD